MEIDNNDFGFTFVDDVDYIERNVVKTYEEEYKSKIKKLESNLTNMYDLINVLLSNLEKNPDKATINWPNRKEEISKFRNKLIDLLETD